MDFLHTFLSFTLAVFILVTIHELGHFLTARKLGVKCLRFCIGFGKPLFIKKLGETEFMIAVVPLGGYVKMLDEREAPVDDAEINRAFNRQSLKVRTAIVAAGPLANIVLAVLAYWLMLIVGITGPLPIITKTEPGSISAKAGLAAGMQILKVDGVSVQTWDGVFRKSMNDLLENDKVQIEFMTNSGSLRKGYLDFTDINIDDIGERGFLKELGITAFTPIIKPIIGKVVDGDAAHRGGLQPGDLVLSTQGDLVESWSDWVAVIRSSPLVTLSVEVRRDSQLVKLSITPDSVQEGDVSVGRIGAEVYLPSDMPKTPVGLERYGAKDAFSLAVERTASTSWATLQFLGKMLVGDASTKNLSGPISIAVYAGETARMGAGRFLEFLGLISVSLAVLNLLPIPMLDGGHLLYYLIEFVSGRAVPEAAQLLGQQIGILILFSLIGLAIYNDILRVF